jgi:hemerythrin
MAFFDWKEEYSVGIKAADDQHKKIIELMNDLFESIRDAREDLVIREILDELVRYSGYHFTLESGLFEKYRYPGAGEHRKEHEHFIDKVNSLMIGNQMNKACVPIETMNYLKKWFAEHIQKTDREYKEFFRKGNVLETIEKGFR